MSGDYSVEEVIEQRYYLVRETPCGWWIHPDEHHRDDPENKKHIGYAEKPRWIGKDWRKKFAYPTKEEALDGFRARKRRQIVILEHKLRRARAALAIAECGNLSRSIPLDPFGFESNLCTSTHSHT